MSDDEHNGEQPYELPVTWSNGGAEKPPETKSRIVQPASDADLARYAMPQHTCGECKFGDFGDAAQASIREQKFYQRLVREEGWKIKHLCSDPKDLGLCGQSGGEMMTGRLHRACDQFKPNNGLVRISQKADR